jgi:hypothetical protein
VRHTKKFNDTSQSGYGGGVLFVRNMRKICTRHQKDHSKNPTFLEKVATEGA